MSYSPPMIAAKPQRQTETKMLKEVKQAQKSLKKAAGYVTMSWFTNTHTLLLKSFVYPEETFTPSSYPVTTVF